jgi:acetoin utilization deacetylase AcuC-like enzyme
VLIVDWDVHHGNGTQAMMERDETIRFVSLHQHPWYPGTGMAEERGVGNVFNVPRGPGAPASRYVEDLWSAVAAATEAWTPAIVLLSAGYDAMYGDPLGGFTLEPSDYARLITRLRERLPRAPIVALLEGGYVPSRVADGVLATVNALG